MDNKDKKEFVEQLIDNIKNDILSRIEAMPENWDGVELRMYIRDKFADCVFGDMQKRRVRKYRNELIVNGKL